MAPPNKAGPLLETTLLMSQLPRGAATSMNRTPQEVAVFMKTGPERPSKSPPATRATTSWTALPPALPCPLPLPCPSTSWCTAHRPRASPCVAMPRWPAPSPERAPCTHEQTIRPASPCAWPRAASAQRTRNCSAATPLRPSCGGRGPCPGPPRAAGPPSSHFHCLDAQVLAADCSAASCWRHGPGSTVAGLQRRRRVARAAPRCAKRGTCPSRWAT